MQTSSGADRVADFLAQHAPFDALTRSELSDLAGVAVSTGYEVGETVVGPDEGIDAVWVVESGFVELRDPDDPGHAVPLDTIGPGGLFGFAAMLVGVRTSFVATASTAATVVRLPGPAVRPFFARPAGLAYLARTISQFFGGRDRPFPSADGTDPRPVSGRTAASLVRRPVVTVAATTTVREAVRTMTEQSASCVVIPLARKRFGIFTDRDLRTRVVASGVSVDVPIHTVMSAPARWIDADRTPTGVLLDMLDLGLQHMLVVDVHGRLVGVLESADLLADSTSRSFTLRRAIDAADSVRDLAAASAGIASLVVDLRRSGTTAGAATGVLSVVVDAVVRRALELAVLGSDVPFDRASTAWISLGSIGRREAMPSSDVDSALSWAPTIIGRDHDYRRLARTVHETLERCGLPADSNDATASSPRFSRSAESWRTAARRWLDDPLVDHGIVMSSLMVDGRVVWGAEELHTVPDAYRAMATDHPEALRLQLRDALASRPRGRSIRDVLSRRGTTVDMKSHAVSPIVNLARWGGLSVGVACASTPARLAAAAGNGLLSESDSRLLTDVFDRVQHVRFGHQADCVEAGRPPTDTVSLDELTPFERSTVLEAIREVAAVQRRVGHVASTVGLPLPGTRRGDG